MPSTRRDLLSLGAGVAAAALAGCTDRLADGGGDDGAELQFTAHREDGPLRERHVVDLTDTRTPWDEEAFRAAVAGEAYTTQHRRPFPTDRPDDPKYVRHEGTYYELGHVVVDEVETSHPVLRLYEADEAAGEDAEAVAVDSLPKIDRTAVRTAYFAARARDDQGGVPWSLVRRGGFVYGTEDGVAESELLTEDGPNVVTYRDRRWRVEHTVETFHEAVYQPDVEPVTDDPERLERVLRARLVDARVDPDDLSQAQRDILREAQHEDAGYTAEYPYPEALSALLRELGEYPYVDGDISNDAGADVLEGYRLLLYGGEYLRYRLKLLTYDP
jgi:hypothetical protein